MRALLLATAFAAMAGGAFAAASDPEAKNPSADAPATTQPGPDNIVPLAEAGVRGDLIDADSAKFRDEGSVQMAWLRRGLFGPRTDGPLTMVCGRVNSKNRMGGYSGFAWFYAAIKDGRYLWAEVDDATDDQPGFAYAVCKRNGLAI